MAGHLQIPVRRWLTIVGLALVALAGSGCQTVLPWGWGDDGFGQVGDGATGSTTTPTVLDTRWASVAIGFDHTLAIAIDGSVWAWGQNSSGQVGDGTLVSRQLPVRVGTATDWIAVTAGDAISFGIKADHSCGRGAPTARAPSARAMCSHRRPRRRRSARTATGRR